MANATYDFLEDLIAAERQISFYAYLESPADTEGLLKELELALGRPPAPSETTVSQEPDD
jgi:hypothetical protein